jgi:hypothetical protein
MKQLLNTLYVTRQATNNDGLPHKT